MSSPDVFQRVERKYLLSQEQYLAFNAACSGMLEDEPYGHSMISSLYYDTPQFAMINRSLEKPLYKEKLRVRAYGVPGPQDEVYVELKKKFDGIVYKRRVGMTREGAEAYMAGLSYEKAMAAFPFADPELQNQAYSQRSIQIAREIDACRSRWPRLRPSIMTIVRRDALHATDDSGVRLTFDHEARWRDDRLLLGLDVDGSPLLAEDQVIMEIKCMRAYPRWLVDTLNTIKAYPCSISKYGRAYQIAAKAHRRNASVPPGPAYQPAMPQRQTRPVGIPRAQVSVA